MYRIYVLANYLRSHRFDTFAHNFHARFHTPAHTPRTISKTDLFRFSCENALWLFVLSLPRLLISHSIFGCVYLFRVVCMHENCCVSNLFSNGDSFDIVCVCECVRVRVLYIYAFSMSFPTHHFINNAYFLSHLWSHQHYFRYIMMSWCVPNRANNFYTIFYCHKMLNEYLIFYISIIHNKYV